MGLLSKKRIRNKSTGRNYKREYAVYQGTAEQKKKRAARNKARRALMRKGIVRKGDGKDVDHKNGNALDNRSSNLMATDKSSNRSFPRVAGARKKFMTA